MNKQEIFDVVKNHLLTQNEVSESDGICSYRTTNGLKCAIGVLIPDEMYDVEMEGLDLDDLINLSIDMEFSIPDYFYEYEEFLQEFQYIHDNI